MQTLNEYCRRQFGEKLYKLSLNGGMTCPNRDGTLDTRGCIFCSAGGSGDFAPPAQLPVEQQIEEAKRRVENKFHGSRYIAYFQSYTNTYAPADRLRELFMPVITRGDIAVLSIATRPDCLDLDALTVRSDDDADRNACGKSEILKLLGDLNEIKPVWVELGLQTSNERTAEYIRRGYKNEVYKEAVRVLNDLGIHVITHIILGLPGESENDMLASVRFAADCGTGGIKLQLLHVLAGTGLALDYENGMFRTLELEEYLDILAKCIEILPENTVVHRFTGDGPKKLLIAPAWSADKKRVLNAIRTRLNLR